MSSEWPSIRLGDFAEILPGYAFKSEGYTESLTDVRLLRGDNIAPGKVRWDGAKRWSKDDLTGLEKYELKAGDIVLAMDRPWIPAGLKIAVIQDCDTPCYLVQRVSRIRPRSAKDKKFLAALLSSPEFDSYIQRATTGTAVPHISSKQILDYEFKLPPQSIRDEIGSTISAINLRISLLRSTNLTLDAISQSIYKSWFIDFDPIWSKMEGKPIEDSGGSITPLFPDSLVETEMGPLPTGWTIGEFGDLVDLRNERTTPSKDVEKLPYVPIESISPKHPFLEESKSGLEANSSLTLFQKGDILFGAMRPYFHKICIAPYDGVTRTTVFTLAAKHKSAQAYALYTAFQERTVAYATTNSQGTTIPYAKWKNSLEKMPIIVPPLHLQEAFDSKVSPLIDLGNNNVNKIKLLTSIRNLILPRIISGRTTMPTE